LSLFHICIVVLLFVHICFIDANTHAHFIEELPTNLEHTSSLSGFRGIRAAQSLVFCVVFCLSLFVFRGVRAAQSLVFCVVFCLSLFVFRGVRAAQSLVFCVVFCLSLFVCLSLFSFVITLSVLLFTASD
jgi:hypothetical protein